LCEVNPGTVNQVPIGDGLTTLVNRANNIVCSIIVNFVVDVLRQALVHDSMFARLQYFKFLWFCVFIADWTGF